MWASRRADQKRLERSLEQEPYRELLAVLQHSDPALRRFADWGEVQEFVRQLPSGSADSDVVLRPIFAALRDDRDPRWREILLAMFWGRLENVVRWKHRWDSEIDHLWVEVQWAFLRAIAKVDVARRRERIAQKVINDTIHELYISYQGEWEWRRSERPEHDEARSNTWAGASQDRGIAEFEERDAREAEVRRLEEHVTNRTITEEDFFLLLGTRIYGQTLSEYAKSAGLSLEVVKKRRQRAEARIRRSGAEL